MDIELQGVPAYNGKSESLSVTGYFWVCLYLAIKVYWVHVRREQSTGERLIGLGTVAETKVGANLGFPILVLWFHPKPIIIIIKIRSLFELCVV